MGALRFGPFAAADPFAEGWAAVQAEGRQWYIDADGRNVLEMSEGISGRSFSEGLAAAQDWREFREPGDDTAEGYIDRTGAWVIEPRYDDTWRFHEGRARVRLKKREGLIDRTGAVRVPLEPRPVDDLRDGRAKFKQAGQYGYLDADGNVAVPPVYASARDFSDGLAAVCVEVEV